MSPRTPDRPSRAARRNCKVVLHVGMQQSGGGVLHRALSRVAPQMRRAGVGYVAHDAIRSLPSLDGWAAGHEEPALAERHRFEADFRHLVEQELARVPDGRKRPVVVVSSDGLLGTSNLGAPDEHRFRSGAEAAVGQIVRALGSSDTTLVLYTRRQDRLMELCYAREVLNGKHDRFEDQFPHATDGRLQYAGLIDRLAGITGIRDVVVRPYEVFTDSPSRMAAHILEVAGIAGRVDLTPVSELRPRPTCSARGLEIAYRMNEFLISGSERARAKDFVLKQFPAGDESQSRFLDGELRARILAAHHAANVEFFARYLPSLPSTGYASEDGTAQLANCTESSRPSARDGARLAVAAAGRAARRMRNRIR